MPKRNNMYNTSLKPALYFWLFWIILAIVVSLWSSKQDGYKEDKADKYYNSEPRNQIGPYEY